MAPDYSLYLVTDSTAAILGERDVVDVVEAAVRGGVTCVQLRDKTGDTAELVATARRLLPITRRAGVPLLINDRVDVALAAGCEGVHVGQDDMDLGTARKLLGPEAIIGVTVTTPEQALAACAGGADYLGIGTVYATPTKTNTKNIIGTAGVRRVLEAVADAGYSTPAVCIGGINASNLERVVFQGSPQRKPLAGVAVVSAVMAAPDPEAAAHKLLGLVFAAPHYRPYARPEDDEILAIMPAAIANLVHQRTPLTHNMTNLVVQNFAANVALAVGASPIMANYADEAADLAKLGGALVVNMGTVTPDGLANYVQAIRAYNEAGRPVVFDPVGAGATSVRRAAVRSIMAAGYLDVIKGNEGEIKTIWALGDETEQRETEQQRGVDSTSRLSAEQKIQLVKGLAAREKNVVVMTGPVDYVSDGQRTYTIANGHEYLGMVTGTGCVLGTIISAAVVVAPASRMAAVVAALLHLEIAAEEAAGRPDVRGPGTFVPALLDELARIRRASAAEDRSWLERARVECVGQQGGAFSYLGNHGPI